MTAAVDLEAVAFWTTKEVAAYLRVRRADLVALLRLVSHPAVRELRRGLQRRGARKHLYHVENVRNAARLLRGDWPISRSDS